MPQFLLALFIFFTLPAFSASSHIWWEKDFHVALLNLNTCGDWLEPCVQIASSWKRDWLTQIETAFQSCSRYLIKEIKNHVDVTTQQRATFSNNVALRTGRKQLVVLTKEWGTYRRYFSLYSCYTCKKKKKSKTFFLKIIQHLKVLKRGSRA